MSRHATHSTPVTSLHGPTTSASGARAKADSEQLAVVSGPPKRSWLANGSKYALILALVCALIGGIEGAIVGALLSPKKTPGSLILLVAIDRSLILGLAGAAVGFAIGTVDRFLGPKKK
jgi:hypothetical protein